MNYLDLPLREVRRRLRERLRDGYKCPACDQFAKLYIRKINGGMANTLVKLYSRFGTEWAHLATYDKSREASKLEYWGLLENLPNDDDGRSPMWRVTPLGIDFIHNRVKMPKYVHVYDGNLLHVDGTQTVSIVEALGTKFDYQELMAGV